MLLIQIDAFHSSIHIDFEYTILSRYAQVKLLERGADKSKVDLKGSTALGAFWASARNSSDFHQCFGLTHTYDMKGLKLTIEALLMPQNGPTAADFARRDEPGMEDDQDQDQDDY